MSRIAYSRSGHKQFVLEPYEAGEHDPAMQDWLQLPIADDDESCPFCPSTHWGTENPIGYFPVRRCHDGCSSNFRERVTEGTLQRVVDALCGVPIRLAQ